MGILQLAQSRIEPIFPQHPNGLLPNWCFSAIEDHLPQKPNGLPLLSIHDNILCALDLPKPTRSCTDTITSSFLVPQLPINEEIPATLRFFVDINWKKKKKSTVEKIEREGGKKKKPNKEGSKLTWELVGVVAKDVQFLDKVRREGTAEHFLQEKVLDDLVVGR